MMVCESISVLLFVFTGGRILALGNYVWGEMLFGAKIGGNSNKVPLMSVKSNLVNCPRQTPTCLVTSDVLDSIGNTPLIRLKNISDATGCEIYAKAEYLNPGGSIKDRIARHIVREAERRGETRVDDHGSNLREHRYRSVHGRRNARLQGCHYSAENS
jgi:hypothetical protein